MVETREISKEIVDFGAHSPWTIVAFSLVYAALSLTALTGNLLVLYLIRKQYIYLTSSLKILV